MNHHINRSLMCLFDFWPTWVAKVVHVSSLMKGIVRELRLVIDIWHSSRTWYLLFRDECRWGTAPDLTCVHMVMMLGGYWIEGCLEKQNSRKWYWGVLRAAVYMGWGELWPRSTYENNMKMQCNLNIQCNLEH
jgi:hypothetical protein